MAMIKGLEWTFDTKAETYEKMRPGYVKELYDDIFAYMPIQSTGKVVEVGIGGGQATLPFLQRGCGVVAVEYGEELAKICGEKFRDYPNFFTIVGRFEDVELPENCCDLIYSATAFHWIPEEIGYQKVFAMLKSGGAFARFANTPYLAKDNPELLGEIQRIYQQYYYPFHQKEYQAPKEFTLEDGMNRANIAKKYGLEQIEYHLYQRTRTFGAEEYIQLLSTYSDHIAIDEEIRNAFFKQIQRAIHDFGGKITIYDTMDLELARKP